MTLTTTPTLESRHTDTETMRAAIFRGPGDVHIERVPRPHGLPQGHDEGTRTLTAARVFHEPRRLLREHHGPDAVEVYVLRRPALRPRVVRAWDSYCLLPRRYTIRLGFGLFGTHGRPGSLNLTT